MARRFPPPPPPPLRPDSSSSLSPSPATPPDGAQEQFPEVKGVASGAILSNYQRTRVENVCGRLGLQSLAFLWRKRQSPLLKEMVEAGIDAVLVKVKKNVAVWIFFT